MIATVSGLTYSYPASECPALDGIDAAFNEGDFALLCGPSAGGKSTLLRSFNGLVPQFYGGAYSGAVVVDGLDAATTPARRMATIAGMVFQEPESQAVAEHVEDEIAFGMEQQGISPVEMHRRCDRLLATLGIEHLRYRQVATLSGGERQRVAIAAVLALEPRLLLLDEPTSQLDPAGAESVLQSLEDLSRAGLTIVVAEHRLDRLLPHVNRILTVESGRLNEACPAGNASQLLHPPPLMQLAAALGWPSVPRDLTEARKLLASTPHRVAPGPGLPSHGQSLVSVRDLSVSYGDVEALSQANFSVNEGEILAIVGANGSGKSTLMRAIAGVVSSRSGSIRFAGTEAPRSVPGRTAFAALVPQDPAFALYRDSVLDEIRESLQLRNLATPTFDAVLDRWDIGPLAGRNPRDLSVGQQQRVAIASMLAHSPRVWMLDEPTRGVDAAAKGWVANVLRAHAASGGAAIVATHDVESAAAFATRVIGLDGGRIDFDLPVREAFGHGGRLPTQVAQLVPGALTPFEVVSA